MSYDRELDLVHQRLTALEGKVDKLLSFRGWVLGGVAAISAAVSTVVAWITSRG